MITEIGTGEGRHPAVERTIKACRRDGISRASRMFIINGKGAYIVLRDARGVVLAVFRWTHYNRIRFLRKYPKELLAA